MPRRQRMYIPDIPVHIVQRGHNRQACFFREDDFYYYQEVLAEAMARYGGHLHAYCLMTNHVHLLLTPDAEDNIQRIMQHLGRQYVQYINRTYKRSGSLWEGRHKGSMVAMGDYLLRCYRYIELNPVTAKMVNKPEEYPWSSYHYNAFGKADKLITPHANYLDISSDNQDRLFHYRELFRFSLNDKDVHQIRECLEGNFVLGDRRFREDVESMLGRRLGNLKPGRPCKETDQK